MSKYEDFSFKLKMDPKEMVKFPIEVGHPLIVLSVDRVLGELTLNPFTHGEFEYTQSMINKYNNNPSFSK